MLTMNYWGEIGGEIGKHHIYSAISGETGMMSPDLYPYPPIYAPLLPDSIASLSIHHKSLQIASSRSPVISLSGLQWSPPGDHCKPDRLRATTPDRLLAPDSAYYRLDTQSYFWHIYLLREQFPIYVSVPVNIIEPTIRGIFLAWLDIKA